MCNVTDIVLPDVIRRRVKFNTSRTNSTYKHSNISLIWKITLHVEPYYGKKNLHLILAYNICLIKI